MKPSKIWKTEKPKTVIQDEASDTGSDAFYKPDIETDKFPLEKLLDTIIYSMELSVKSFYELSVDELYRILKLRVDVFVVEQNCPYEEIDDQDQEAIHLYLSDDEKIEAYLRIIDEDDHAKIGRVIAKKRRKGLGTTIMKEAIRVCKEVLKKDKIIVEAQTYAREFYEKLGFRAISEPFDLDGIEHIKMIRE